MAANSVADLDTKKNYNIQENLSFKQRIEIDKTHPRDRLLSPPENMELKFFLENCKKLPDI